MQVGDNPVSRGVPARDEGVLVAGQRGGERAQQVHPPGVQAGARLPVVRDHPQRARLHRWADHLQACKAG